MCILEWGVPMGLQGNDGDRTERDILTGWAKEARAENLLTGDDRAVSSTAPRFISCGLARQLCGACTGWMLISAVADEPNGRPCVA